MEQLIASSAVGAVVAALIYGMVTFITSSKTLKQNAPLVAADAQSKASAALNDTVATLSAENARLGTRADRAEARAAQAEQRAEAADLRVEDLERRFEEMTRWLARYWRAEDHDPNIPPPPFL